MSPFIELLWECIADIVGVMAFDKRDRYEFAGRIAFWLLVVAGTTVAACIIVWLFGGNVLTVLRE